MQKCKLCENIGRWACPCQKIHYCSEKCQKTDWPEHSVFCSTINGRRVEIFVVDDFPEWRVPLLSYRYEKGDTYFDDFIRDEVLNINRNRVGRGTTEQKKLLDLNFDDISELLDNSWSAFENLVKSPRKNSTKNWEFFMLQKSTLPGAGVGLFARKDITPGMTFEYGALDLSPADVADRSNYVNSKGLPFYIVQHPNGNGTDGKYGKTYPAYANSFPQGENMRIVYTDEYILFECERYIRAGEEIFVDYDAALSVTANNFIPNYLDLLMQLYGDGTHVNLPLFDTFPRH